MQKDDVARAKKTDEASPDDDVIDENGGGDDKVKPSASKKKASKSALEAEEVGGTFVRKAPSTRPAGSRVIPTGNHGYYSCRDLSVLNRQVPRILVVGASVVAVDQC